MLGPHSLLLLWLRAEFFRSSYMRSGHSFQGRGGEELFLWMVKCLVVALVSTLDASCKSPFHSQLWQRKVSLDIAKCLLGSKIVLTEVHWPRDSGITQYTSWKTSVNLVFYEKNISMYCRGLLWPSPWHIALYSKILGLRSAFFSFNLSSNIVF